MAAAQDFELGGMQLPWTVAQACFAWFNAANISTAAYPFLTVANANLIRTFGSEAQKQKYLPSLLSGRFFGTMCLSEPQAGSSLSDIRTTAHPNDDGSYRLVGNKMWISAGEHDLSDNIVHLVLARIQGAPAGVKGISLFIVPKIRVNDDGSLAGRNDVALAGLNHKMGFRGTTNCVLNFGEQGGAYAELVGEPNKGLACMFQMMNEARIGVGMGATVLGLHRLSACACLRTRAAAGAAARRQECAAASGQNHRACRREAHAARAKGLRRRRVGFVPVLLPLWWTKAIPSRIETARRDAELLLDILTPVAKAWPSQYCLEANSLAIQVHGGYGYTREYPVEQFYRDNRLNPIHEGTNGIQALDLLGRKAGMNDGAAIQLLAREVSAVVREASACDSEELQRCATLLNDALDRVMNVTRNLLCVTGRGEVDLGLANASVYLDLVGHTVIGWIWLKQAMVAVKKVGTAHEVDRDFYQGKLQACAFFFRWELPKTGQWSELLDSLDPTCLDMQDAWF